MSHGQRSSDDLSREVDALSQAHLQNETARDAFLALAHTALFAASVSFVSDVAENHQAKLLWLLIAGWLASVLGLLALTWSYFETSRHIRTRFQTIFDTAVAEPRLATLLNTGALLSFPVALISTFVFAAANIAR